MLKSIIKEMISSALWSAGFIFVCGLVGGVVLTLVELASKHN